jgi:hypothetical protein
MKIPLSLAAALTWQLAACTSPGMQVHQQTAHGGNPPSATPSIEPTAPAASPAETTARTACAAPGEPPVPAPRAVADVPTAPRTTVAVVGSVCSALTGEPLSGVAVAAQTTAAFCAEGHQPWRCGYSTVTDRDGHYGLTLFDVDAYDVTVGLDGYRAGGGLLRIAHPGVTTADWVLTPLTEPVANTPAAACSTSGPASASWAAAWNRSAGPAIIAATATGDTFTLTFDHGTPAFEVSPTSSTAFIRDPKGDRVVLAGPAGVAIHLSGFRGDVINFQGTIPRPPAGSLLREVRETGDFEGEIHWAAGLAQPACAAVTSSGSTLTFHFIPTSGKG